MFSKLFEILPDAEDLLNLEPEERAGPLLVSLDGNQGITPSSMIASETMLKAIQRGNNLNYPNEYHNKVLFALMEAWQWLEREGFVAQRPSQLANSTTIYPPDTFFVTRRGKRIQTSDDLDAYRKSNLLPKGQLNPIIAQKVWSMFLQGDYDTAVFQAFKQVEVAVREAGYYADTEFGVSLMRAAFHKKDGALMDSS